MSEDEADGAACDAQFNSTLELDEDDIKLGTCKEFENKYLKHVSFPLNRSTPRQCEAVRTGVACKAGSQICEMTFKKEIS